MARSCHPKRRAIEDAKEGGETILVGTSPAPHAEFLDQVKGILANHGYALGIKEFSDYIQPNVVLADGGVDANYVQHITYMEDYNAENGTDIVSAGKIQFDETNRTKLAKGWAFAFSRRNETETSRVIMVP